MTVELADRLYEFLEDEFGESLRSVGYYSEARSGHVFVRADIESEYDEEDLARIYQEVRLEAMDRDHQESLYRHGTLLGTLRFFDEATELHIAVEDSEGVTAAVDSGAVKGARNMLESAIDSLHSQNRGS